MIDCEENSTVAERGRMSSKVFCDSPVKVLFVWRHGLVRSFDNIREAAPGPPALYGFEEFLTRNFLEIADAVLRGRQKTRTLFSATATASASNGISAP